MNFLKKAFHKHEPKLVCTNARFPSRLQIRRCTICGKWFEYDKFEDRLSPLNVKTIVLDDWKSASG